MYCRSLEYSNSCWLDLVYLMVLFYLAATLMLGVIFNRTRNVTAIAFFIFIAEASFNAIPWLRPFESYSVFALQLHGTAILVGKFPSDIFGAVGLTIVFITAFLSLACWWINRSEF